MTSSKLKMYVLAIAAEHFRFCNMDKGKAPAAKVLSVCGVLFYRFYAIFK